MEPDPAPSPSPSGVQASTDQTNVNPPQSPNTAPLSVPSNEDPTLNLETMQHISQDYRDALSVLEKKNALLEEELASATLTGMATQTRLEKALGDKQRAQAPLHDRIRSLERHIQRLKDESRYHSADAGTNGQQHIEYLEQQLENLTNQLADREGYMEDLKENKRQLDADKSKLQGEIWTSDGEAIKANRQIQQLQANLSEAEARIERGVAETQQMQSDFRLTSSTLDELQKSHHRRMEEINNMNIQLTNATLLLDSQDAKLMAYESLKQINEDAQKELALLNDHFNAMLIELSRVYNPFTPGKRIDRESQANVTITPITVAGNEDSLAQELDEIAVTNDLPRRPTEILRVTNASPAPRQNDRSPRTGPHGLDGVDERALDIDAGPPANMRFRNNPTGRPTAQTGGSTAIGGRTLDGGRARHEEFGFELPTDEEVERFWERIYSYWNLLWWLLLVGLTLVYTVRNTWGRHPPLWLSKLRYTVDVWFGLDRRPLFW